MNRKIHKIGNTYRYEICDEDLVLGRHYIDLAEDGFFLVSEICFDADEYVRDVDVFGTYFFRGEKKEEVLYIRLGKDIPVKDILSGKYTAGEVLQLPWDEYSL